MMVDDETDNYFLYHPSHHLIHLIFSHPKTDMIMDIEIFCFHGWMM